MGEGEKGVVLKTTLLNPPAPLPRLPAAHAFDFICDVRAMDCVVRILIIKFGLGITVVSKYPVLLLRVKR